MRHPFVCLRMMFVWQVITRSWSSDVALVAYVAALPVLHVWQAVTWMWRSGASSGCVHDGTCSTFLGSCRKSCFIVCACCRAQSLCATGPPQEEGADILLRFVFLVDRVLAKSKFNFALTSIEIE